MPPRTDLEPQENASTGPKDSQIGGGRYPHGHRKTCRNSSLPRVPTKHPRVAVAARRLKRSEPVPPQQRKQLARLPDGLSRSGKMQVGVLEASTHLRKLHKALVQLRYRTVGETLNARSSKLISAV